MTEHVKAILERKKMGLAASQARLLTITSRKADCEFQSMQLSHEKIALSRDMEKISDEYQAAMNKTKLVYDYYGSGTSQMALNYGLLMTPSGYNDYYPRILTDSKNRAVLSAPYAQAATEAGIPKEGYNGTPSSEVRNKFIEALRDAGIISASTAADIESVSYNNGIGIGSTFSASAATQDITYDDLLELIKAHCVDSNDYGLPVTFNPTNPTDSYLTSQLFGCWNSDWNFRLSVDDGNSNQSGKTIAVNLYDLLKNDPNKQYTISSETGDGATFPAGESAFMQRWLVGTENSKSFLNWMVDQFSSILGGVSKNDLALQYAYNEVYDLLYPNENLQRLAQECLNDNYYDKNEEHMGDFTNSKNGYKADLRMICAWDTHNYDDCDCPTVRNKAKEYIGGTFSECGSGSTTWWDGGGGRDQGIAFNLNNIAKVFLTAFKEYLVGIENSPYSYNIGKLADANLYTPVSSDIFQILAPTDVTDGTENLVAGFYDALFNRICIGGWTENDNITDAEYMQELLKNGSVYISSIDNDGSYYQSNYATDTYISEVPDTEGIAKAEAKYNSQKAKLENKENTIDMKMKNLDTEISSLTTEYDTMKNVISKTIEKSFKRYEA